MGRGARSSAGRQRRFLGFGRRARRSRAGRRRLRIPEKNRAPEELALAGAASGLGNGVIAGSRGTYNWKSPAGYLAATLDSTVGLLGTTLGNLISLGNMVAGAQYSAASSFRQNRQVYTNGAHLEGRHAFTLGGNVVSNAGAGSGGLLNHHETLHLWQSRLFGPTWHASYVAWGVGGAIGGGGVALFSGSNVMLGGEAGGYVSNPFEHLRLRQSGHLECLFSALLGGDRMVAPIPRVSGVSVLALYCLGLQGCAGHGQVVYKGTIMSGDSARHVFVDEPSTDAPAVEGARVVLIMATYEPWTCANKAAQAPKEWVKFTGPGGTYEYELTFGSTIFTPDHVFSICVSHPDHEPYEYRVVYETSPEAETNGTKFLNFYLRRKRIPESKRGK